MAERETEDRRVRKTKKQLRGALTSLLLEKDISRVTVRDVADLADVNRGTFYAHYSDVYDLLHQLEDDLLRRLDDVGSRHNARQSDGKTFRYLTDLFTLASEYSDIFYTLYCRSGDSEFQDKIFNKLKYQYLYEFLSIFGGSESEKLDYCASFIVAGMCTLAKVWIENGMRETPEEMARLGGAFVMHGVESSSDMNIVHVLEAGMLVCFGISWPFNIAKSIRSRTAKGKSVAFELLIIAGYLCGLVGKLILGNLSYVVFFYIADILMVAADLVLTLRNRRLDRERDNI